MIATAIIDGLLHDSHVLNIRGDSYRPWEKRRSDLFAFREVMLTLRSQGFGPIPGGVGHLPTGSSGSLVTWP